MSTIHLVSSRCCERCEQKKHLKAIACKRPTVSNGPEIFACTRLKIHDGEEGEENNGEPLLEENNCDLDLVDNE